MLSQKTQMLQQDFETHQDQYDTAEQLCAGLVLCAEHMADLHADARQHKRGCTDERHRRNDIDLPERKRHTDRKRINARGNRKRQHGHKAERIADAFVIVLARLAHHVCANKPQQHKGDPVINARDERLKAHAECKADERH